MKTSETISSFLEFLRKSEADYHIAIADENEANDETQDILHAIEFGSYSERPSVLLKKLKKVRNKRRNGKDQEEILSLVVKWAETNKGCVKSLEQLLGSVRKAENRIEGRRYMPRTDILDPVDDKEE